MVSRVRYTIGGDLVDNTTDKVLSESGAYKIIRGLEEELWKAISHIDCVDEINCGHLKRMCENCRYKAEFNAHK